MIKIAGNEDHKDQARVNHQLATGAGVLQDTGTEKVHQTINIGQIQALIGASLRYDMGDKQANGRSLQDKDTKDDVIDVE